MMSGVVVESRNQQYIRLVLVLLSNLCPVWLLWLHFDHRVWVCPHSLKVAFVECYRNIRLFFLHICYFRHTMHSSCRLSVKHAKLTLVRKAVVKKQQQIFTKALFLRWKFGPRTILTWMWPQPQKGLTRYQREKERTLITDSLHSTITDSQRYITHSLTQIKPSAKNIMNVFKPAVLCRL